MGSGLDYNPVLYISSLCAPRQIIKTERVEKRRAASGVLESFGAIDRERTGSFRRD
jgi:hypothetical protein